MIFMSGWLEDSMYLRHIMTYKGPDMWQPIATAPMDRAILLWFPDGKFACPAIWECIAGGEEDGTHSQWEWIIADDLSEQDDGIVWDESQQPSLWTEVPDQQTNK